jgi:hypothetical protein
MCTENQTVRWFEKRSPNLGREGFGVVFLKVLMGTWIEGSNRVEKQDNRSMLRDSLTVTGVVVGTVDSVDDLDLEV